MNYLNWSSISEGNFGQTVSDKLDSVFAEIDVLFTSITNWMNTKDETEMVIGYANTPIDNPLTTEYSKAQLVNTIQYNSNKGFITMDIPNKKIIFESNGVFALRVSGAVELTNNNAVYFKYYKNGEPVVLDSEVAFDGAGAGKGIAIISSLASEFEAGDFIEIFSRVNSNDTVKVTSCNVSVEKKIF